MRRSVLAAVVALAFGCGKRGAPLAPLRVEAEPVAEFRAAQRGAMLVLESALPARYTDGEPFELGSVRVLLASVAAAPATATPTPEPLLPPAPPPVAEGPPFVPAIADRSGMPTPRPRDVGPSPERFQREARTVLERRSPSELAGLVDDSRLRLEVPAPEGEGERVAVAIELRGLRSGDRGRLTPIALLGLVAAPPAPPPPAVANQEDGLLIQVGASEATPRQLFRRLTPGASFPARPVGGTLTSLSYLDRDVAVGASACYALATVASGEGETAVSALSEPVCMTRRDTFAPEAPSSLQAFSSGEGVLLTWRPSRAADLRGYRVYRRVGDGRPEQVNETAVVEPSYLDAAVPRGRRVSWQVTAVDGADPVNESAPTAWVAADSEPAEYR